MVRTLHPTSSMHAHTAHAHLYVHACRYILFAVVDKDHSGFITYDELWDCVRHKLHKGPKVISDVTLKPFTLHPQRPPSPSPLTPHPSSLHPSPSPSPSPSLTLTPLTPHPYDTLTLTRLTLPSPSPSLAHPSPFTLHPHPLLTLLTLTPLHLSPSPSPPWPPLTLHPHGRTLHPKVISDVTLKSIFSVLDVDEDDQLHKSEVRAFLEKGRKRLPPVKRQGSSLARDDLRLISPMERYNMSVPIPSKVRTRSNQRHMHGICPSSGHVTLHPITLHDMYICHPHEGDVQNEGGVCSGRCGAAERAGELLTCLDLHSRAACIPCMPCMHTCMHACIRACMHTCRSSSRSRPSSTSG